MFGGFVDLVVFWRCLFVFFVFLFVMVFVVFVVFLRGGFGCGVEIVDNLVLMDFIVVVFLFL